MAFGVSSKGVDTDSILAPRPTSVSQVVNTGVVGAGPQDAAARYAPLTLGSPPAALGIAKNGNDFSNIFAALGTLVRNLTVTTSSSSAFNFKTWALTQDSAIDQYNYVNITVNSGVQLSDSATGVFTAALKIINNGDLYGPGGRGGSGGNSSVNVQNPGTAGSSGGDGLALDMNLTLDNTNGQIWGGGGGGGGGGGVKGTDGGAGGGGGGGGQGYPGGAGGGGGNSGGTVGQAGTAGTISAPGFRGAGGSSDGGAPDGGNGAGWATVGSSGGTGGAGPGAGGAAGYAIRKNGYTLTLIAQGNTLGMIG